MNSNFSIKQQFDNALKMIKQEHQVDFTLLMIVIFTLFLFIFTGLVYIVEGLNGGRELSFSLGITHITVSVFLFRDVCQIKKYYNQSKRLKKIINTQFELVNSGIYDSTIKEIEEKEDKDERNNELVKFISVLYEKAEEKINEESQ